MSARVSAPGKLTRRAVCAGALALAACDDDEPRQSTGTTGQSLWLGGDVHLGDESQLFASVPLRGVGVVNLEGTFGPGPHAEVVGPQLRLTNPPKVAEVLRSAGVGWVTITNNHRHDGSVEATVKGLAEHGVTTVADSRVDASRWSFLARDLDAGEPDLSPIAGIAAAGRLPVVSLHVTGPPSFLPRPELVAGIEAAIAAGARAIVGVGTHALARVERRAGPRGDVIIAMGLGNLRFACACTDGRDGLVLELTERGGALEACVVAIRAGLEAEPTRLAANPNETFDLLASLRSSPLRRDGARAWF